MGDLTQTLLKSLCEPGRSRLERVRIVRLENDFDVGTVGAEAWVRAYTDSRVDLYCLGENPDDPALRRAVAVTPGSDRRTRAQFALDRLVHRLHLRRQAGKDVDVFEHEPGRPAERVGQWAAAGGKAGPAGRILRVGSKARSKLLGDVFVLGLLDAESRSDGLARDVVGRSAEATGDDD